LRRLGGVGCTACHGPGAIPERSGRWAILRTDVCAVCHDAPPRYPHVADWRRTRMSRADAEPATRVGACATCHTTVGFLASLGVRSLTDDWEVPPAEHTGIACAACHAAHGATGDHALLRQPPLPPALADAPVPAGARICLPCHANGAGSMWLARGGVETATGKPLTGTPIHLLPEGCVGCHRQEGHRFVAGTGGCARCHREVPRAAVFERAMKLWQRLQRAPLHAPPHSTAPAFGDDPLGRAARNVMMVLDDPAAVIHNPPYARALLDEAERALGP
jgi:hypothetical protein